jgi:hypothetical protein
VNALLAWRMAAGRRSARVSLTVRTVGVAFATLVLLLATSADSALDKRGDRITWRTDWAGTGLAPDDARLQVIWWDDYYFKHGISYVQVAALDAHAPIPPGLPSIPGPGEVFLSPALAKLVAADLEVLGSRYGETVAGTISDEGLASPNELVAIAGFDPAARPYEGLFYRELPTGFQKASMTSFLRIVLVIGVVVLLFPIAMFIAAAARLNAQETDARLAALRLAGADPVRVRWLVSWEAAFAAIPGVITGLALLFVARGFVAQVAFDGNAFFPSDFSPSWLGLLVLVLVPAVVVGASFVGLRDVEISPLGVSRRAQRRPVRPIGLLFLAPGFALTWYVLGDDSGGLPVAGLAVGVVTILIGVTLTGTWIGHVAARVLASRIRSGSALLALRRIAADPHGSFRTVSGVTFAVFAGTLFLSLSAALAREVDTSPPSGLRPNVFWVTMLHSTGDNAPRPALRGEIVPLVTHSAETEDGWIARILEGDCAAMARALPIDGDCHGRVAIRQGSGIQPGSTIVIDSMPGGDVTFTIPVDAYIFHVSEPGSSAVVDIIVPEGTIEDFAEQAGITYLVVPPDGAGPGDRAFELLRTDVMRAFPAAYIQAAREYDEGAVSGLRKLDTLVHMGTFVAFMLSGATAAMSVAGGILARRRAFALLRMSGCSISSLRRTVMAEATLPLILVSVISAATAVAVSAMMIWRAGQGSVIPPPEFVLPLFLGLALGLAMPLITLPLLGAVTRSEQTRFD